jgi:hypothetical protein
LLPLPLFHTRKVVAGLTHDLSKKMLR